MFDLNLLHDQDQDQDMLSSPQLQSCSSSSSLSNPTFLMTAGFIRGSCDDFPPEHHKQDQAKEFETSCNIHSPPTVLVESDHKEVKFKIRREDNNNNNNDKSGSSAKWMSSKMRMMKKMMSSDNGSTVVDSTTKLEDHHQLGLYDETDNSSNSTSSCNNSSSSSVRVCVDCNTTKTPLWRSGPTGPKSLCNACGIRQRKARRAMAAAAVNGEVIGINPPPPIMKKVIKHKNKRSNGPQFKKRCKINTNNSPSINSNRKTISFEDLRMRLISNSGFEQVFPQDEKEAAILLMALSYGLVH